MVAMVLAGRNSVRAACAPASPEPGSRWRNVLATVLIASLRMREGTPYDADRSIDATYVGRDFLLNGIRTN